MKDTIKIIQAYNELGDYYSEASEFKTADSILKIGLNYAMFKKNSYQIGIVYNLLAANSSYNGDRPQAFSYYHKALKYFADIKDFDNVANTLMNIGSEYEFAGNLRMATAYKLKALKNKETSGIKKNLDYYYQNVGQLFKESNYEKWEYYVNKAYEISNSLPQSRIKTRAAIFNDLGGIAELKKNHDQALIWYDSMLVISKKENYLNGINAAYSNRSLVYKELKDYNMALKDIKKALELDKVLRRNYSEIVNKIHAGQILIKLKRYGEARVYLNHALKTAKDLKYYPEEEAIAHQALSIIGEATKNWKEAYYHYALYKEGIDSIRGKESKEIINKLEIKYQTIEKEKKIEELNADNHLKNLALVKNKIIIISLVIVSLFTVSIILLFSLRNRLRNQKLQAELQQKLLRSQMNPHFIFNTLNAIGEFIRDNNAEIASDYLAKYAKLMRQILENSAIEFIPIETEIDFLRNYLAMQQLRFVNRFVYEIIIDPSIDTLNTDIPPMLAQPFIENAIEHGIRGLKTIGKIQIVFTKSEKFLILQVKDNGCGINTPKTNGNNHTSFATQITRDRLKTHGFSRNALIIENLDIHTEYNTVITIKIPCKMY